MKKKLLTLSAFIIALSAFAVVLQNRLRLLRLKTTLFYMQPQKMPVLKTIVIKPLAKWIGNSAVFLAPELIILRQMISGVIQGIRCSIMPAYMI